MRMPTNDERREIADRLRTRRKEMESEKPPSNRLLAASVYLTNVGGAVRVGDDGNLFNRLADLIDPADETCEAELTDMIDARVIVREYECSKCGMLWETVWAYDFAYCPYCGRRIENAD